jgi:Na+-driven multidrug efflux pump
VLLLAAQVLLINPVFKFWVGDKIHVPLTLSLIMAVYFVAYLYTAVYTIILNGAGRVKVQAIVSIVTAALHIPVVLFFIRYLHWGLNSIVFSGLLWVVIQFIAWRSEIKSVLRREAVQPDDQFDDDIVKTSKLLA